VSKWKKWFQSQEHDHLRALRVKMHEMTTKFRAINPSLWDKEELLEPDYQFVPIWPIALIFVDDGAGLIRFLTAADCPVLFPTIENVQQKTITHECDICQLKNDGQIETVMRVYFPAKAKYRVTLEIGCVDQAQLTPVDYIATIPKHWVFEVEGAPSARRRP
jgi:hypothetical protein